MNDKDTKLYILTLIMGVCLIPIFLLYNTHHQKLDIDIEKVTSDIVSNFQNVEKDTKNVLYDGFDIDKDMVEEYVYYYPIDSMLVEELLMIRLKDMKDHMYIKKAIDEHIQDKKDDFISYGVDQYSILLDAKVYEYNPYIVYVVHKDMKKIDSIIKEKFRQ